MWILAIAFLHFVFAAGGNGIPVNEFPAGCKENPGKSCQDIKERGGTSTGNYYITLNQQTLLVHCDQDTAGGGWTLVYSYTFTDFEHFGSLQNAVTPRPNWNPKVGNTPISTTPPRSETDYNAMDFRLWKEIGNEFMVKSNVNNWILCVDASGSLVSWINGSIKCKLVKNFTGMCPNVVPNTFSILYPGEHAGPILYRSHEKSNVIGAYYNFFSSVGGGYPTHDPCGKDSNFVYLHPSNPHGNIYIR